MDTVITKPPTQKDSILEWIKYNPNEFITNELVKDFPHINRRVLEKVVKAEVVDKNVTSKKCQCGCANIYQNNRIPESPEWT